MMSPDVLAGDQPIETHGTVPDPPADLDGGGPLSIGLVSPGWPPDAFSNGIVTYVACLAEGLRALGHRVTILAHHVAAEDGDDRVCDIGRADGTRGHPRRILDRLVFRAAPRWAFLHWTSRDRVATTRRAVAERGIEVLEMEESFGWVDRVQRAVRIPVSVRLHGPWFLNGAALGVAAEDGEFRRRVALEGRAIRRAAAVTAPSRDVLEQTRGFYGLPLDRAEVIPNPTRPVPPAERWRPGGCDPRTVLFVGRFDRHKGGDLIIEAFGRALRAVPDARLWFVGPDCGLPDDNGRRWDLEGFVDDRLPGARMSGRVELLGQQPHSALDGLRRRALVSVVCSRYDVFGLTAAEAMALGCPVVAARVGGLAEIIRDGVDGLQHRAGDPDDLAAKLVALLTNPARAAELGRRAAVRCEQELHPVVVAARMVAHYRRIRTAALLTTQAR